MKSLKKGSLKYLKGCKNKPYVKLENLNFAWWRLENETVEPENRMQVRMTDEMVWKETHFIVKPK